MVTLVIIIGKVIQLKTIFKTNVFFLSIIATYPQYSIFMSWIKSKMFVYCNWSRKSLTAASHFIYKVSTHSWISNNKLTIELGLFEQQTYTSFYNVFLQNILINENSSRKDKDLVFILCQQIQFSVKTSKSLNGQWTDYFKQPEYTRTTNTLRGTAAESKNIRNIGGDPKFIASWNKVMSGKDAHNHITKILEV